MTAILHFTELLFAGWSISITAMVGIFAAVFWVASWSVCFMGAFCQVKRTPMYVAMLSVASAMLVALLLGGLIHGHLPDLANEFTPWGLLILSFVMTSLVFSVPLIQCFWRTSYLQGLSCLAGGFLLILVVLVTVQMTMQPIKSIPARPSVPIFANP